MRKILPILVLLSLVGMVFAQSDEKVVAKIDDEIEVTLNELQGEIRTLPQERLSLATTRDGVKQLLDQIIQRKLMAKKARDLQMDTVEVVKEAIRRSEDMILSDFLVMNIRMQTQSVTEEEARNYYQENEEDFYTQLQLDLKQIVVGSQEMANEVKKKLDSGKDFDALIQEYPGISGGAQSGSLGVFGLGQLASNVGAVVQNLDGGEWGGPVQTDAGFHFLYVVSRKEPTKMEYDKISGELVDLLNNQKVQVGVTTYVQSLVDDAKITIDNAILKEAVVEQQTAPMGN